VELVRLLLVSIKGMPAADTSFRDRFNYGSRTVANHEQGREIWFVQAGFYLLSKERLLPNISSSLHFFSSNFLIKILPFLPSKTCEKAEP
jgi:hypothetical protein